MSKLDDLTKQHRSGDKVDIVMLAKSLGLGVFAKSMPDKQNGYIQQNDEVKIVVNRSHPLTRQRFTIAHEVGHYINDKKLLQEVGQLDRTDDKDQEIERKADEVAAELLMPAYMVKEFFDKKSWTEETLFDSNMVTEIANSFAVSRTMAVTRLREIGCQLPYISFA